ncbi:MAG TPA: DnaB-like helicase C-terminal domain-containing protein [Gemmatimonadales bacterium]|nr:DnaB-like helicase C-terminal domain-containing protein [Gemmatimonadales bacterium]
MTTFPTVQLEAEQAVLGALLLDAQSLHRIGTILPAPEAFTEKLHRDVFTACRRLVERRVDVDPVTIRHELEAIGVAVDLPALSDLVDAVPTSANIEFHANIVADAWRRRRLNAEGERLIRASLDPALDLAALVPETMQRLVGAYQVGQATPEVTYRESLHRALDRLEQEANTGAPLRGLSTGFEAWDELTDGFRPGQQIVLAGRPSEGKSALALRVAAAVAAHGPVLYLSREMPRDELVERLLSSQARVTLKRLRNRQVFDNEFPRLARAAGELHGLNLHFDSHTKTAAGVRFAAECLKAQQGALALVVVDYLQLLDYQGKASTRDLQIGEITAGFKQLAMDLQTCVLTLSQLNRKNVTDGRRPELHDLRDSGNIEQDADQVAMIYWPEAEIEKGPTPVDLLLRKNRNGPKGSVPLCFETWTGHWFTPPSQRSAAA